MSGFNIEYRSGRFGLLFLAEMSNILFICIITRALFFRPRIFTLFGSTALFVLLFLSTRTSYPRLRYDLLIRFFWLYLLPQRFFFFVLACFMCALNNVYLVYEGYAMIVLNKSQGYWYLVFNLWCVMWYSRNRVISFNSV